VEKADITAELVADLIAAQFPEWSGLLVRPVDLDGWDNTTFRLGPAMLVRLPSADGYAAQVDKEQRWLPVLAPQLPLPIPVPLGRGEPSARFPRPWSVYRWLDGEVLSAERVRDQEALASDLAGFLAALYGCTPEGPSPGAHSFSRGGPVATWDDEVRSRLATLDGIIDTAAARDVWETALGARSEAPSVWVHGDITGANLLVRAGRLAAVLDFGCCAFGDPACDLTIAWTFLEGEARSTFKRAIPVEPSAWARGRGWALWKALNHCAADQEDPGWAERFRRRVGWRVLPGDVIAELIVDHQQSG